MRHNVGLKNSPTFGVVLSYKDMGLLITLPVVSGRIDLCAIHRETDSNHSRKTLYQLNYLLHAQGLPTTRCCSFLLIKVLIHNRTVLGQVVQWLGTEMEDLL